MEDDVLYRLDEITIVDNDIYYEGHNIGILKSPQEIGYVIRDRFDRFISVDLKEQLDHANGLSSIINDLEDEIREHKETIDELDYKLGEKENQIDSYEESIISIIEDFKKKYKIFKLQMKEMDDIKFLSETYKVGKYKEMMKEVNEFIMELDKRFD
jgi:hypothetical protein